MKFTYTSDDLTPITDEMAAAMANTVMETVKKIHPMMAGKRPEIQGAIIADLLGTYLAGYPPEHRGGVVKTLLETAKDLVPITERAMGNFWDELKNRTVQ